MFWLEAEVKGRSLSFFVLCWIRKGLYTSYTYQVVYLMKMPRFISAISIIVSMGLFTSSAEARTRYVKSIFHWHLVNVTTAR